jgi:hypothetical protein
VIYLAILVFFAIGSTLLAHTLDFTPWHGTILGLVVAAALLPFLPKLEDETET